MVGSRRRRTGVKRLRRIMHASDFSPASRGAFRQAVGLARTNDAELLLVHVVEMVMPWVEDSYVSRQTYDRFVTSARTEAARRLDGLVRKAKAAGVRATAQLVEGGPRDAIPRAAKRGQADLLVLGTHGRTGLGKILLGSVAERVVTTAPCPVLTVRGRS
jgi:nucleotide-binding universal stress UspA family protein